MWLAPEPRRAIYRRLAGILGVAVLSGLAWVTLMFKQAIIQHSSYAMMIMLFTALAAAVAQLPLRLCVPLLLLNVTLTPLSILGFPGAAQYAPVHLILAAASAATLVAFLAAAHGVLERPAR